MTLTITISITKIPYLLLLGTVLGFVSVERHRSNAQLAFVASCGWRWQRYLTIYSGVKGRRQTQVFFHWYWVLYCYRYHLVLRHLDPELRRVAFLGFDWRANKAGA